MRAVLSAGSNMGDARAHLRSVVDEFAGETVAVSSVYATAPWGKTDQPDFLNQSLLVDVDASPHVQQDGCGAGHGEQDAALRTGGVEGKDLDGRNVFAAEGADG